MPLPCRQTQKTAVYSYGDSGIYLDADVSAENTAGGRPFEGVDKTAGADDGITLGTGCEAVGVKVHTVPRRGALLVRAGRRRAGAGKGDGVPPCVGRPGVELGTGLFCRLRRIYL